MKVKPVIHAEVSSKHQRQKDLTRSVSRGLLLTANSLLFFSVVYVVSETSVSEARYGGNWKHMEQHTIITSNSLTKKILKLWHCANFFYKLFCLRPLILK